MLVIKEILKPNSIKEAYDLYHNEPCRILGGGAFLRLSNNLTIDKALDLYGLGLDDIESNKTNFKIGSMVTLRDIETNSELKSYFNGILSESVSNIVGVQLRNIVTIGGTVYPKYGFSDLLTTLMVLDTTVEFYNEEPFSLASYLSETSKRESLLEAIHIKKDHRKVAFKMMRNSASDFAIINVAVSEHNGVFKIAVGARPGVAKLATQAMIYLDQCSEVDEQHICEASKLVMEELSFGDNRLGSAFYRKSMCETLVRRTLLEVINHGN